MTRLRTSELWPVSHRHGRPERSRMMPVERAVLEGACVGSKGFLVITGRKQCGKIAREGVREPLGGLLSPCAGFLGSAHCGSIWVRFCPHSCCFSPSGSFSVFPIKGEGIVENCRRDISNKLFFLSLFCDGPFGPMKLEVN